MKFILFRAQARTLFTYITRTYDIMCGKLSSVSSYWRQTGTEENPWGKLSWSSASLPYLLDKPVYRCRNVRRSAQVELFASSVLCTIVMFYWCDTVAFTVRGKNPDVRWWSCKRAHTDSGWPLRQLWTLREATHYECASPPPELQSYCETLCIQPRTTWFFERNRPYLDLTALANCFNSTFSLLASSLLSYRPTDPSVAF